ncbi:UDP-2,3-diacylglucosamine diphosphatase [Elusimicrobiota bacterium]
MFSVFIADLHLGINGLSEKHNCFINFLEYLKPQCNKLYILGDLFSYWYEHPGIDFYSENRVLKAVKEFSSDEKKVYFIYGNRDFTAGEFFRRYSGVEDICDEFILEANNKKILLNHGDKFAKKDVRYQIWRIFIRSQISSFIFKNLPVGIAIRIVDKFKTIGKNRPARQRTIAENMISRAEAEIRTRNIDTVIMAHAHFQSEKVFFINGKEKNIFIIPEFEYPGKFLIMEDNDIKYRDMG